MSLTIGNGNFTQAYQSPTLTVETKDQNTLENEYVVALSELARYARSIRNDCRDD